MTDFATINKGHRAYERNSASRALRDCRKWGKENPAALQAEWDALPDVPRTIEAHHAYAEKIRKELGL